MLNANIPYFMNYRFLQLLSLTFALPGGRRGAFTVFIFILPVPPHRGHKKFLLHL